MPIFVVLLVFGQRWSNKCRASHVAMLLHRKYSFKAYKMPLFVSLTHQSANISHPAKNDVVSGAQEAEWQRNKSDSIWHLSAIFQPPVHQKHHQSLMDRSCLMLMIIGWMMWRQKKIRRGDFFVIVITLWRMQKITWNSSHPLARWCNVRFRSRIH